MNDSNQKAAAEDHYYAALDLFSNGNHDQAIREYQAALEIDPSFTDAMHGLCRAHQDLNQLDEAIAVANRIAALDANDLLAHTSLSILYQKKGLVPEAETEANKGRVPGRQQPHEEPAGQ